MSDNHRRYRSLSQELHTEVLFDPTWLTEEDATKRPTSKTNPRRDFRLSLSRRDSFSELFWGLLIAGAFVATTWTNTLQTRNMDEMQRQLDENARFTINALTSKGALLDRLAGAESRIRQLEAERPRGQWALPLPTMEETK